MQALVQNMSFEVELTPPPTPSLSDASNALTHPGLAPALSIVKTGSSDTHVELEQRRPCGQGQRPAFLATVLATSRLVPTSP